MIQVNWIVSYFAIVMLALVMLGYQNVLEIKSLIYALWYWVTSAVQNENFLVSFVIEPCMKSQYEHMSWHTQIATYMKHLFAL